MNQNTRWLMRSAAVLGALAALPVSAQTGLPPADQGAQPSHPSDRARHPVPERRRGATSTAAAVDTGKVEDIVVTAQRRSENIQKVPIAITAVTGASLARHAVRDVTDLKNVVPGLNITNEIGFVTSQLRGVGSTLLSVGYENPVAIYVDGIYYASPSASNINFTNVERVEVLKGPQGTLFGRNATGGLINVITKDPSRFFGGNANVSYGNYGAETGDLYVTGGLAPDLAMDLALQGAHQGQGWGKNLYTGKDVYTIDHDVGARSKLVYKTADTRIALSLDYNNYRNTMNSEVLYPGIYSAYTGALVNLPGYDTNTNVQNSFEGYNGGASLSMEQNFGLARVRSITAYRLDKMRNIIDIDETPTPALAFAMNQRDRQISQEFQILSQSGGRLNWVAGAYYFNSVGNWDPFRITIGAPLSPFPIYSSSYDRIGTDSLAGYLQGTYAVTPDTRLTLGGRYTSETRSRTANQTTIAAATVLLNPAPGVFIPITAGQPVGPPASFPQASLKYNKPTFRVSLDHDFSPTVLGYASFNRGFKSGGYNPAIYSQALLVGGASYGPEQLDAYEAGLKTTLAGGRIRLNVAGFYYDYSNLQIPFIIETTVLTINGAAATIYGTDGDFEYRATDALRFTGGFQLLHDRYTSFPVAPLGTVRGGIPLTTASAAGHQLDSVPSVTLNGGVDYTVEDVEGGSLRGSVNAAYKNGYYFNPDNIQRQGGFVLVDATIRWTSRQGFSIGVYGKNLLDVKYIGAQAENSSGDLPTQWAAPRTFGVTTGIVF